MVLLGIVPILMHTPPTASCFSTMATRLPALAPWMAARCPPGPEPITIKSNGCIRGVLGGIFVRGANGVGRYSIMIIDDCRRSEGVRVRRVNGAGRDMHEVFLDGKAVTVARGLRPRIATVGAENARLARIGEIGRKNFGADALAEKRILDREYD